MSQQKSENEILHEAAHVLVQDIGEYMKLQSEELSDTFELVFRLNQAAIGRYGELIEETKDLQEKAKALQEQEIGVASLLSNLSVIEGDIKKLEDVTDRLEKYCSFLEEKASKLQ